MHPLAGLPGGNVSRSAHDQVKHQFGSFPKRSLGLDLWISLFSFFFLRIGLCKFEADVTPITALASIWHFLCVNCSDERTNIGIKTSTTLSSPIFAGDPQPLRAFCRTESRFQFQKSVRLFMSVRTEISIVKNRRKHLLTQWCPLKSNPEPTGLEPVAIYPVS